MILNKQIGVFLNLVHNHFKKYITEVFESKGYNITPEQFIVLDTLWDEGVLSQQQISSIILKDKNSVVKLVDRLEERGLVKRVNNVNDRRENLIKVTNLSMKIKDEVTTLALDAVNQIIKDIPTNKVEIFIEVLSQMGVNMNKNLNLLEIAKKYPRNKKIKSNA